MKAKSNYCYGCMAKLEKPADVCPECGRRTGEDNPLPALPCGSLLDKKYTVGAVISSTSLTTMYIGADNVTGDRVFIEEFLPAGMVERDGDSIRLTGGPENVTRFRTLVSDITDRWKRLAKVDSPAMLNILEIASANGTVYCVTSYKKLRTLSEYLGDSPMPWHRAKTRFMPVLTLLSRLHNAGLVHSGISPESIVVDSRGNFLLTGFALPEIRKEGSGFAPQLFEGFAAPEQYSRSQWQGEWTDIYSIGALLYRALTGVTPPSADERQKKDELRPPREIAPSVPENVSDAVMWAMEMQKNKRFAAVNRFTAVLLEEAGSNTAVFRPEPAKTEAGPLKLSPVMVSRLLALLLAVSAVFNIIQLIAGTRQAVRPESSDTSESTDASQSGVELMSYDFVGMYLPALRDKLAEYTDISVTISYENNSDYPENVVYDQSVRAGDPFPSNGRLTLYVSSGPEYSELPNMLGWPLDYAKEKLTELKINFDVKYSEDESASGNYNTVIAMSREAGTLLRTKTSDFPESVTLTVKIAPSSSSSSAG